jgi:hypothetical protein
MYHLLTSVLDGGNWSASRLGCFNPLTARYPLKRRLGGSQSLELLKRENLLFVPRIEPRFLGHTARSLVTVLAELSRLSSFNFKTLNQLNKLYSDV